MSEDGQWYVVIKGYLKSMTFEKQYVHQLQNFYFALTSKELTLFEK